MKSIIAECSLDGYLRYGHYELELSDEEYEEFNKMGKNEQHRLIRNKGELIVDDYEISCSHIDDITVE